MQVESEKSDSKLHCSDHEVFFEGEIEIEAIDSIEFKGSTTTITPILNKEDKVITVQ